jgi:hypothetical protein
MCPTFSEYHLSMPQHQHRETKFYSNQHLNHIWSHSKSWQLVFILPIQQRVACRSVDCLGKEEKLVFAFFGIIVAAIGAWLSFDYFTANGVNPDLAAGYAVAIFALILGAFGLIAVRVDL